MAAIARGCARPRKPLAAAVLRAMLCYAPRTHSAHARSPRGCRTNSLEALAQLLGPADGQGAAAQQPSFPPTR